jgi:dihydrofolate reductase
VSLVSWLLSIARARVTMMAPRMSRTHRWLRLRGMTKVTAQMSISLDGRYTGPMDPRDPQDAAGWMQCPEAPGFLRVPRWVTDATGWRERQGYAGGARSINSDIIEETFAAAGAYVMGRRMFDGGEIPWGDTPPFRAPVFVVTHRPRATLQREGGTSFTFVTGGIEQAVVLAREAAGGKDVAVAGGGTLLRQVIGAGLLEQLGPHIAPVVPDRRGDLHVLPRLLGDGTCLYDVADGSVRKLQNLGRR